jgi:hypothetical protein
MTRANKNTIVIIAVVTAATVAVPLILRSINQRISDSRTEARYTFDGIQSLTEDLAVAKSREVMSKLAHDEAVWEMVSVDEQMAPYDTVSLFLRRNSVDPNRGFIQFVDKSKADHNGQRIVSFEVKDGRMVVEVIYPK